MGDQLLKAICIRYTVLPVVDKPSNISIKCRIQAQSFFIIYNSFQAPICIKYSWIGMLFSFVASCPLHLPLVELLVG